MHKAGESTNASTCVKKMDWLTVLLSKIKKNTYPPCNYVMIPLVAVMMKVTLMLGLNNNK
jgi:hypothetical protein